MARAATVSARIWVDPAFAKLGSLPPYPEPPGDWSDLFAAIEVEAAEQALKAVRVKVSSWRKPANERNPYARAALDRVVHAIDEELAAVAAFAWGEDASRTGDSS